MNVNDKCVCLIDQKKQDMVHQERFEQAKHLKQAIADLQKVYVMCGHVSILRLV